MKTLFACLHIVPIHCKAHPDYSGAAVWIASCVERLSSPTTTWTLTSDENLLLDCAGFKSVLSKIRDFDTSGAAVWIASCVIRLWSPVTTWTLTLDENLLLNCAGELLCEVCGKDCRSCDYLSTRCSNSLRGSAWLFRWVAVWRVWKGLQKLRPPQSTHCSNSLRGSSRLFRCCCLNCIVCGKTFEPATTWTLTSDKNLLLDCAGFESVLSYLAISVGHSMFAVTSHCKCPGCSGSKTWDLRLFRSRQLWKLPHCRYQDRFLHPRLRHHWWRLLQISDWSLSTSLLACWITIDSKMLLQVMI